jgi:uncharacterized RDD family membrane protein YckC
MENKNFTVTNDLLASHSQRLLNFLIDLVIQYIIWISAGTTIDIIADITKSYAVSNWIESLSQTEKAFSALVVVILYYGLTDLYFSRSLAKYFTKTVVVMKDGSKPDFKTILIRTSCRLIPFEAFSFLGSVPRGWHDSISQTYVVKKVAFEKKKRIVIFP